MTRIVNYFRSLLLIELLGGLSIGIVAGVSIGYMARRVKA